MSFLHKIFERHRRSMQWYHSLEQHDKKCLACVGILFSWCLFLKVPKTREKPTYGKAFLSAGKQKYSMALLLLGAAVQEGAAILQVCRWSARPTQSPHALACVRGRRRSWLVSRLRVSLPKCTCRSLKR